MFVGASLRDRRRRLRAAVRRHSTSITRYCRTFAASAALIRMGKVELQHQIRDLASAASTIGGCLIVERRAGDLNFIEPENVQLLTEHVEARDVDGTRVQIPYASIAGVTVDLP